MPKHLIGALAALAILAGALAIWMTRQGPGLNPDSAYFIAAARSIAAGEGVRTMAGAPLTHFPPGYPAVLALARLGATDPLRAARWIDAALFAALAVTVGVVAWRASSSARASVAAVCLVLTTPDLAALGALALSESLAIALGLAGLAALATGPDERQRARRTWSALAIAGSILTRYAAGAFWLAGALVLLRRRQWREAVRWSIVVWLPVLAWLVRNHVVGHSATHRTVAWHPPALADLGTGLATIGKWLLVTPKLAALAPVAGAVGLIAVAAIGVRARDGVPSVLAVGVLAYVASLLLARAVADAMIPFDARLLAPTGIFLAVLAPALLALRWPHGRVLWLAVALGLAVKARYELLWGRSAAANGLMFSNVAWRTSRTVARLPADGPLYANWVGAPYLLRNRVAMEIPRRYSSTSGKPTPDYRDQLAAMARTGGTVVYFDTWETPKFFPTADELRATLPLVLVDSSADGRIYRIASPAVVARGAQPVVPTAGRDALGARSPGEGGVGGKTQKARHAGGP